MQLIENNISLKNSVGEELTFGFDFIKNPSYYKTLSEDDTIQRLSFRTTESSLNSKNLLNVVEMNGSKLKTDFETVSIDDSNGSCYHSNCEKVCKFFVKKFDRTNQFFDSMALHSGNISTNKLISLNLIFGLIHYRTCSIDVHQNSQNYILLHFSFFSLSLL